MRKKPDHKRRKTLPKKNARNHDKFFFLSINFVLKKVGKFQLTFLIVFEKT